MKRSFFSLNKKRKMFLKKKSFGEIYFFCKREHAAHLFYFFTISFNELLFLFYFSFCHLLPLFYNLMYPSYFPPFSISLPFLNQLHTWTESCKRVVGGNGLRASLCGVFVELDILLVNSVLTPRGLMFRLNKQQRLDCSQCNPHLDFDQTKAGKSNFSLTQIVPRGCSFSNKAA